jgi:hypothetical protein
MTDLKLSFFLLPETLAICRLEKDGEVPGWAFLGSFVSITRTSEELSVVCPQIQVPEKVKRDAGWRCLKVEGPLDLSATGVLASFATPLAREGISLFALSTYDTDYLLVKDQQLEKAVRVLKENGHKVLRNSSEFGAMSSE